MVCKKLNVIILTGNELRHKFFAVSMSKYFNVMSVVYERKANVHEKTDYGKQGNIIIQKHFQKRLESEISFFSEYEKIKLKNSIYLETGLVNEKKMVNKFKELNPDYILLFGSSLIGDEIIQFFKNRVINLHLGLSPYYRGSGTLFWPLVEGLPECVGSTIHLAVKKIDAGGILYQVRPKIESFDSSHSIGNKTIIESVNALFKVVNDYHLGKRQPKILNMDNGRLFLRKHLHPDFIIKLNDNMNDGMLTQYIKDIDNRKFNYPIIT